MAAAYTKKQTEYLIEQYIANPTMETVRKLCVALNKPPRSIIAKLSREGVYEKVGYRDKRGEVVEKKTEIVNEIQELLDLNKLMGLDKAPKLTLKRMRNKLREIDETLETALVDLNEANENMQIMRETTAETVRKARERKGLEAV
jgi:hypothetical protein